MIDRTTRSGLLFVVGALLAISLVACGGASSTRSDGGGSPAAPPANTSGEAKTDTATSTGGGVPSPSTTSGRLLTRTGSVDLVVKSVTEAAEAARRAATSAGGFVSDSSFSGSGSDVAATLTLRVPGDRLDDVVASLRALAIEVRSATTSTQDVTEEAADLEATLRNLRAVEGQYQTLLNRSGSIPEVLQVQERLNQTRLQIDRTEARRRVLAGQVELATLNVSLRPEPVAVPEQPAPPGRLARIAEAWRESVEMLDGTLVGAAILVAYLWWMIPIGAALVWGMYVLIRRLAATPLPPTDAQAPPEPTANA